MGTPSSRTCVCSLRNPRVKTEVNWPAVPVCTTDNPGTSRSASLTRSICFCSISCDVITLTLAGDSSSGISVRVALTITASAVASLGDGVGDGSCARLVIGASVNQIPASQSPQPFCFHITSFPPFFERRTCLAEPHGPRLSFFFLRRSFFVHRTHGHE